ncbi:hypothetical protein CCHR01_00692 [Colletotrichum chrysophilum]|uniref:Uncharacterized protein n=1 Tax=Colletotrichum chrysophilum TaxID=1836956 RepID=A0AAD9AZI9_9PEZI|nr:hypothetical protein CCHR01_00692 [Colletotrichum chrysophilum]
MGIQARHFRGALNRGGAMDTESFPQRQKFKVGFKKLAVHPSISNRWTVALLLLVFSTSHRSDLHHRNNTHHAEHHSFPHNLGHSPWR